MIRHNILSNPHIINENEESTLRNKPNRLTTLKGDTNSAVTPRRAFGEIKNFESTPASGLKKNGVSRSFSKQMRPTLVFEDESSVRELNSGAMENSFDKICSQFLAPLSPWKEYPEIEKFGTVPCSPVCSLELNDDTMVLHEVPGFNASLDELCAKFYEEPSPWSPEETPDVETFPITDESWDDVDGIMDKTIELEANHCDYSFHENPLYAESEEDTDERDLWKMFEPFEITSV